MKRTFRNAATVAGLIEKNLPGAAQDRPAGDLLLRHPLRHPAQVRPRPPAAAHHPRRGRPRPRRLRPHRGDAGPQPRPPRASSAPRTSPPSPRRSSSRWAACRSRAGPRPAWSARPPPRSWPRPASPLIVQRRNNCAARWRNPKQAPAVSSRCRRSPPPRRVARPSPEGEI